MKHNGEFITYERMGNKIKHMLGLGYEFKVVLENREGTGIMYFEREGSTTIAVPIAEFNISDEVEIEYNELGEIQRLY